MNPELVIGTAQFGMNYGITNKTGKVKLDQVSAILDLASKYSIFRIDTAQSYGDSEVIIGKDKSKISNFKISSKLKAIDYKKRNSQCPNWDNSLKKTLCNLNVKKLDCLFVHNSFDLRGEYKKILLNWLIKIKKKD